MFDAVERKIAGQRTGISFTCNSQVILFIVDLTIKFDISFLRAYTVDAVTIELN